jgi:hypothetical protein
MLCKGIPLVVLVEGVAKDTLQGFKVYGPHLSMPVCQCGMEGHIMFQNPEAMKSSINKDHEWKKKTEDTRQT